MKKICLVIGLVLSFSVFCFGQESDRIIDFPPNAVEGNLLKAENNILVPTDMKGVELIGISVEEKNITPAKVFHR